MMSDRLQHLLPPEMRKKAEEMAAKLPPIQPKYERNIEKANLPVADSEWIRCFKQTHFDIYGFQPVLTDEILKVIRAFNVAEMDKGVCIVGGTGNGKTSTLCTLSRMLRESTTAKFYRFHNIGNIREAYAELGESGIHYASIFDAIIDDIGSEGVAQYMGNKANLSEIIIMSRYNKRFNLITHFTANLTLPQLKHHVGERAFDRIKEMCEIHVFTGKSLRK